MTHKTQYTPPVHEHIEEWHHHTAAEGLPQAEHGAKPNMLLLAFVFVGSVAFVGATILATYLYFNAHTRTLRAERAESTAMGEEFRAYQLETIKKLTDGYVWLNDDAARAGHVTLPLAKAEERILLKYAAK